MPAEPTTAGWLRRLLGPQTAAAVQHHLRTRPWPLLPVLALAALLYMKFAMAATYTVNTTADTSGSSCSGTCSLRQAIGAANGAGFGPHTINIDIPGCGGGCTITLGSNLTDVNRTVIINGTAQSGFSGVPLIRVDGNGNDCFDLKTNAAGSTIRGLVLSNCTNAAVIIESNNNLIAGNYIGTNLAGTSANANNIGVWIKSGSGNTIGGSTAADRNVISGNSKQGIDIDTSSNLILGNYIGVAANGTSSLGNGLGGIFISGGRSDNKVGGVNAADANIIANNGYDAITLASGNSSGNSLLRNIAYNNLYYSIDLGDDGVTSNDTGDGDGGVNEKQNFPVLTSAVAWYSNIVINGTLNSNSSTNYRIEFYSTPVSDSSGHGEGQVYLGSTSASTNGSGNASYNVTLPAAVTVGHKISATATVDLGGGNYGSTSEFATNITSVAPPAGFTVSAISGNTTEAGGTATFTVVLDRAPTANVTIPVSSSNTLEGTPSSASLVFTPANWFAPQTVTVTGQPDNLVDGNRAYTIVLGNASSADGLYNGLSPGSVAVTNVDIDTRNTLIVDTISDVVDGTTTSLYALLSGKGADGNISLREAITAANNTANGPGGPNRIHFNITAALVGGAHTIQATSALPTITRAVTIDGTTEPDYASNPVIELDGSLAGGTPGPAGVPGLYITAGGSTVRGLAINRFTGHGIRMDTSGGNVLESNRIGTDVTGAVDRGNGAYGVYVLSVANNVIGGTPASKGNIISGNDSHGVVLALGGAVNNTVINNRIGTDASGTINLGNTGQGILFSGSGANLVNNNPITGNTIAFNAANGVQITFGTGNALLGNLFYSNGGLGIDLGTDGVTANDTGDPDTGANNLQNFPVLSTAVVSMSGTQITITGTLNSLATTPFRIEFFASSTGDASGYGQGQRYLGSVNVTTDGSGNGAINALLTATVTPGERISATATKSNGGFTAFTDTSEFSAHLAAAPYGYTVSGRVYEDLNYGGGAGRSFASSGGVGVGSVRVELYDSAGVFENSTTTAGDGSYSFALVPPGNHFIRVASQTVASTRTGSVGTLRGVMTWRSNASTGTAVAVTDRVGGTNPAQADPGSGSSGATLNTSTYVFTAVLSGTAHAVTPVTVGGAAIAGLDFGFNFDTVSNINNSGQGSLRQVITNANALGGDGSLAVSGRTAGMEHVIFMLADGTTRPGLSSTLPTQFAAGVAIILPTSGLPAVTSTLVVDAQTQPGWVQDPIIELRGTGAAGSPGMAISGGTVTLRGLIVNRFPSHGVSISGGAGHTVQGCWIGTDATGAAAAANAGAGIAVSTTTGTLQFGGTTASQRNVVSGNTSHGMNINGGTSVIVQGNYVGTNAAGTAAVANGGNGVWLDTAVVAATVGGTAAGAGNVLAGNAAYGLLLGGGATTVQGNFIGTNVSGSAALANSNGIVASSAGHTIGGTAAAARNVVSGNTAAGLLLNTAASGTTVQGNTIGRNASLSAALPNNSGVDLSCNSGCAVGGTATGAGNTISGNTTVGVRVNTASQGNAILGNATHGNTGIGIDLNANGVTTNDGTKTAGAGNQLMDHPVFTSARARGNQLTVAGYVGSAAGQALFGNARVEIFASDQDSSGYGEGQTYLGFVTTDASGNFSATLTMAVSRLAVGTRLTGTATDTASNTSEFGANFAGLIVDLVVNHNGDAVDASPGNGICETATANQCTLRAALAEVNAMGVQPGALTIAFELPGCTTAGQAACIITPATALPAATQAVIIDGQTQPGWVLAPLVELVGSSAPAGTTGLAITGTGSTVRGLVIGGFNKAGISLNANNALVQGNVIGLQGNGSTARGNGNGATSAGGIWVIGGSGIVIGGNTAAQRNVVSGNTSAGIYIDGGTVTVKGNYIGTNAAGTAGVSNGLSGLVVAGGSAHVIGGAAAGEGNVISGNTAANGGGVLGNGVPLTIQGNLIGTNAAGNAYIPNGNAGSTWSAGIDLRLGSGHVIGGTAAGQANTIAGNQGHGIRVATQNNRISGNRIVGNLWRGIDLNGDDVTANDGLNSGAQPNNGMDHPVVTGAGVAGDGLSITVMGYIGTGSGQAVFAGATVQVFKAVNDGSGYGQGQTYLGTLTADGNGRFYGTLAISFGTAVVGDAITATATDGSGNTSEFGPNWTSTTLSGLSPASFNVFETNTTAGALTGVLRSKVADSAATVAVLALDSAGTAPHPGFTGTVQLRWLDARDDSGAVSGSCRASWVDLGAAGSAAFSNENRINVGVTPPATGTRSMRLQITYTGPGGTVVACSNDAFAALPAQLAWVGASDTHSALAGTVRTLDNTAVNGGVVHNAGRPFTLRAQALSTLGTVMNAYDGTPALAISSCVLPVGCTAGALGGSSATAAAGVYQNNTVTYAEVGAIGVQLTDTGYASVDAADTALGARTFGSNTLQVGRFVPDSYQMTLSTSGVLATANAACMAPGSAATFMGQGFGWATPPQVTVTARNASMATTTLWTGTLMKLTPGPGLAPTLSATGTGTATLAPSYGAITLADLGSGQARLTANALDRFVLDVPAAAPQATVTPTWQWQLNVSDNSEAGVSGNGTPSSVITQSGVPFDQGGSFHSGRLSLSAAHGDARSGVRMLMALQRFTNAGWVTMTEDRGCVTVQRDHIELSNGSGAFAGNLCAAPLAASATTAGGRAWLSMPATPAGATGRLSVRVAGTAASGSACSPTATVQAVTSTGLPWLTGGASGAGPSAQATWGSPSRDLVLRREIW